MRLQVPESGSLKSKRRVVKSVVERIRHRYNASVAEVDDHDLWQLATIGIACVARDVNQARAVLDEIVRFIEAHGEAELIESTVEIV